MRLLENSLYIVIYENLVPKKIIEHLPISVEISDIGLNSIPTADIKVSGLSLEFSQKVVAQLNVIGLKPANLAIEVYAGKKTSMPPPQNMTLVFSGALIGGDLMGAPNNELILKAKVGAEMLGSFSFFLPNESDNLKTVVQKFVSNAGNSKFSPPKRNLSIQVDPSLAGIKLGGGEINGDFLDLFERIKEHKPNIRYVFGFDGNSLGFKVYGQVEKTHVIQSMQILNQVDIIDNITTIGILGFFDDFKGIKIGDGIKIKSKVKSQLNYLYQVVGMNIILANKEASKWHIKLKCQVISRL